MNTLSIVASFGALVWIFQDGNLSALLGFQPLGFVETTQPVILFCVLFGLSMDYEVFLLSRMKEVWDRTGDNTEAVARGLERSGRIVTSAALIVVARGRLLRVRRHRADQGARGRAWRSRSRSTRRSSGRSSCRRRCASSAAGTGGCRRRWSGSSPTAAGVGGRHRGGGPMTGRVARPDRVARPGRCAAEPSASASARSSARWSRPGRLLRRRPDPGQPDRAAPVGADAQPRPDAPASDPLPVVLPRDDGPHDRLTEWWYDTGHLRAGDGPALRVRIRDLPRRTRRVPDLVGLAPRDHRRVRRPIRVRAAARGRVGQVDVSPRGPDGAPTGSTSRSSGRDPSDPDDRRAAGLDDDRRQRDRSPDRDPRAGRGDRGGIARAASGSTCGLTATKPPAFHDGDGWIDFGDGRQLVLLLADRDDATGR